MINSFLELHLFFVILISVIAGAGLSFIALVIVRRKLNWESFKENHEVGGFLFNALGLIYAALIAFVVLSTWQEYDSSLANCEKEANMLQSLYLLSNGLPDEYQPEIKTKILEYIEDVIKNDWPLMAVGKANNSSKLKLIEIWKIYEGMKIDFNEDINLNDRYKILFAESLIKLNGVTDFRRLRILSSQNHIPVLMWAVILIGALTSVGFSLFFGTKSFAIQAAMTSLFAITNVLIILLVLNLDNPFSGDIKILPLVFEDIFNMIQFPEK